MFNIYEKMVNYCFSEMRKNKVFYHTKNHISEVLLFANEIFKSDKYKDIVKEKIILSNLKMKSDLKDKELNMPLSVFIALLFHDVVYDVTSKTNEYDSAIKMYSFICENFKSIMYEKEKEINLAYSMILATKDHLIPKKISSLSNEKENVSEEIKELFKIVLDVDMFTLSKDYKDFLSDSKLIEKEYRLIYSEFEYDIGRKNFLDGLLNRKIYLLDSSVERENKARENIDNYIKYKDRLRYQQLKHKFKDIFK